MFNSKHNRRNTASTASPSRGSPLRSSADRRSPGRNSPKFSPDHDMRPDMSREERAEYKELFDILDDD